MISLAKFSIRRPRLALAGWLVGCRRADRDRLRRREHDVAVDHGRLKDRIRAGAATRERSSSVQPSSFRSCSRAASRRSNRVGPQLVVALMKRPHTRVLSAWDAGAASTGLRPKPTAAMIVVSVDRPEKDVVKYDQPAIEQLVKRQIGVAAVTPYITGQPSIDRALKDAVDQRSAASRADRRRHRLRAAADRATGAACRAARHGQGDRIDARRVRRGRVARALHEARRGRRRRRLDDRSGDRRRVRPADPRPLLPRGACQRPYRRRSTRPRPPTSFRRPAGRCSSAAAGWCSRLPSWPSSDRPS